MFDVTSDDHESIKNSDVRQLLVLDFENTEIPQN